MGLPIFIFFILFAVGSIVLASSQARARRNVLAQWATARQLYFSPDKSRHFDDEHPNLDCLRRGSSRYAYNIISGEVHGLVFTCFDYHYSTGSGKNRRTHRFSGVFLRPNFPLKPLLIRPERFFDKVKAGFGMNDIDFESAEFSREFYVAAPDKRWAYDVITTRMMEFLMRTKRTHPNLSFEFDHELICIVSKKIMPTHEIEEAHYLGKTILDELPDYVKNR